MIINIVGWVGTLLVLCAYFLVSNEKLEPAGNRYNLINLAGAICIGANVFANHAWPSVGLNLVWGSIAIFALLRNLRLKVQSKR